MKHLDSPAGRKQRESQQRKKDSLTTELEIKVTRPEIQPPLEAGNTKNGFSLAVSDKGVAV